MIRFFVERGLLVNLISIFLVVVGFFYAGLSINREAFPNVNLDTVQVNLVYPGATPKEVERLVITPIEQEIKAVDGINKMTSISYPGSGRILLELDSNSPHRSRVVSDIQLAVSRADIPKDLPSEPTVLEIDGQVFPIINLAVSATRSDVALKRLGDDIEDDLLAIPGIAKVVMQGDRRQEIRVVVDPQKIKAERISIGDISRLLSNWNVNAPGGDLETSDGQKSVRIVGEFAGARDVRSLVLRANDFGQGVKLGDIATVSDTLEKATRYYDVSGKPAMNIIIMKRADADIIDVVDKVKKYMKTIPGRYGKDVKISTFQDMSYFTRLRLGVLTNNGFVGIILVFISLILFLRPSVALTTTWGLPIVFFTGLFALYVFGITLNLISMLGFIMVLGMLVDDAIIIGENITYHMEKGMAPNEAAVKGASELVGPVTATVMTTVVAFLPLMFMSGIIGKFIVAIPVVVISLLFFSWLESFLILPSHVAHVTNRDRHPGERAWLVGLENLYGKVLEKALEHRWLTVFISLLVLAGSILLAVNKMSFQLFPAVGVDQFIVRVTAPSGTSLEQMRKRMRDLDARIRRDIEPQYLDATLIETGEIAVDGGDSLMQRGSRYGQIRVIYTPAVARPDHNALEDMHKLEATLPAHYPDLKLAFGELKGGPPTGRALEVEISSNDNAVNEQVARRLMTFLKSVPGVSSVESGLELGDDELQVVFDRQLAAYAGVDLATAANYIRAAVGGLRVSTTRRGTQEVDVTIRFPQGNKDQQLSQLEALQISNQKGGLVPLSKIAKLVEHPGYSTIRHKAGIRVISVVANIDAAKITSLEINKLVSDNEAKWVANAKDKVAIQYGGEQEKNQESFKGLIVSLGIALLGIFLILAIQFNNITYPLLVMLAIPFGAIGIIISFYLHDMFWRPMPLSFFSTLGMVALTGVVVNSSLVLLVFIQRALQDGMPCRAAIIFAGRRRLRAVLLTAITTVVGLLPTAYGWGGMDPFVAPLALSLSWGLMFATLVTLVTIPAALAITLDVQESVLRGWHRLRHKRSKSGHGSKEHGGQ